MMRLLVVLLLLQVSALVVSSREGSRLLRPQNRDRSSGEHHGVQWGRLLEDERNDNRNDDNMNDDASSSTSIIDQAKARAEEDLIGMWSSPPSEWLEEYWEVFAGILGLVMVLLLCLCIACMTPCEPTEPLKTPDKKVLSRGSDQQYEASLLDKSSIPPDPSLTTKNTDSQDPSMKNQIPQKSFGKSEEETFTEDDSVISGRPRKTKPSLVSEVISVWSEFFTELFAKDEKRKRYEQPYRHYGEAEARRYRAPSSRKPRKRQPESDYETDVSASKVEKYQGMVV